MQQAHMAAQPNMPMGYGGFPGPQYMQMPYGMAAPFPGAQFPGFAGSPGENENANANANANVHPPLSRCCQDQD